jgi:DNA topoisomerase-1
MPKLIVVESPTKAKTIGRFLGPQYRIVASSGHIRDLPTKSIGYDEETFEPQYEVIANKKNAIKSLKDAARGADEIIIATDPDREGEAIGWHVTRVLGLGGAVKRMEFHEITQKAIDAALAHPRTIDMNLVNSQQARRLLDRMVGYKLSPVVWRKVQSGTSAGRVQSVAVRVICDREREIRDFVPKEYWTIAGLFTPSSAGREPAFTAMLTHWEGRKAEIGAQDEAEAIAAALRPLSYGVKAVETRRVKKSAPPSFTTSTLQQAASNRLNFTAKHTMKLAQELYEGLTLGQEGQVGLITYMRTDSVNLSDDAISAARDHIARAFGPEYVPAKANRYKTRAKGAQEAHEAIRPTDVARTPDSVAKFLGRDQLALYRLIWQRFVACQMVPAEYDRTTVDIAGKDGARERAIFRATASPLAFPGYLAAYGVSAGTDDEGAATERDADEGAENKTLPPLTQGQLLRLLDLVPEQHFTKPPARYNEASLVKYLEEQGIGRPSTYATILSTILDRGYVEKQGKALVPTPLGFATTELLVEHFPDIVDTGFTAHMETELDEVAEAEKDWKAMLRAFATPFEQRVQQKLKEAQRVKVEKEPPKPTGEACPECGKPLVERVAQRGRSRGKPFVACSDYPACKYVKREPKEPPKVTDILCPQCGKPLVERVARRGKGAGKPFLGCSGYPQCKHTQQLAAPAASAQGAREPEAVPV